MRQTFRDAAIRRALGKDLAPHLVRASVAGPRVTLLFAGSGWETNLAGLAHDLEQRVAQALGRESLELEIRSLPQRSAPTAAPAPEDGPTSGDPLARLRRAAARILARRSKPC